MQAVEINIVPNDLQKSESDTVTDRNEQNVASCQKLCKTGTDPIKIQDCIGYCEKLMLNTIELQKQPRSRFGYHPSQHTSMLFEGIVDASDEANSDFTENDSRILSQELSAAEGRNKLLSRDNFNLLMAFSLLIGFMMLMFALWLQRSRKAEGHFYLPRPAQSSAVSDQEEKNSCSSQKNINIGKYENTTRAGYIPLREEEIKLD